MNLLLSVAAGGAVGAAGRYLVMIGIGRWGSLGFPLGTLVVNVVGCLALGAIVEASALIWSPSQELRAFLIVGVLGSFTTFSAFSLETVTLFERGQTGVAAGYVLLSVLASIAAFVAGLHLTRAMI